MLSSVPYKSWFLFIHAAAQIAVKFQFLILSFNIVVLFDWLGKDRPFCFIWLTWQGPPILFQVFFVARVSLNFLFISLYSFMVHETFLVSSVMKYFRFHFTRNSGFSDIFSIHVQTAKNIYDTKSEV